MHRNIFFGSAIASFLLENKAPLPEKISFREGQLIQLKNKSISTGFSVVMIMLHLETLWKTNRFAFEEFIKKCYNSKYAIHQNTISVISKLGLMDSEGNIHISIKNMALSAITISNGELQLDDPVENPSQIVARL